MNKIILDTCIPVSPGSKPKQTPEFKIKRLLQSTSISSVMAADYFHMVRRHMAGKSAGNPSEEVLFNVFQHLSPKAHEVLKCTLDKFESLPAEDRTRLFNSDFLGDINLANNPVKIRKAVFQEVFHHATLEALDTTKCTTEERPGRVRTQPNPGVEFPPSQVLICRINGLRTGQFVPRLAPGEYTSQEITQTCHMETDQNNNSIQVCEPKTTNCPPGTDFDGICLRLHEFEIGGNVALEGMNFSSIDTKVQFKNLDTDLHYSAYVVLNEDPYEDGWN